MGVLLAMQSVDKREWQEKVLSIYSQADVYKDRDLDADFATDEEENGNDDGRVEEADGGERHPQHHESEIGDIMASQAIIEDEPEDTNSTVNTPAAATRDEQKENGHGENEKPWWEVAESDSQLSANSFSEVGSARTPNSSSKRTPSRHHHHRRRQRAEQQVWSHFVRSFVHLSRSFLLACWW